MNQGSLCAVLEPPLWKKRRTTVHNVFLQNVSKMPEFPAFTHTHTFHIRSNIYTYLSATIVLHNKMFIWQKYTKTHYVEAMEHT